MRRKIYEQYKIIGINEIKGIGERMYSEYYQEKIERAKRTNKKYGLLEPFEVIKTSNGYKLISHPLRFYAAKQLDYKAVSCLIRKPEYEIILYKTLKKLNID